MTIFILSLFIICGGAIAWVAYDFFQMLWRAWREEMPNKRNRPWQIGFKQCERNQDIQ